MVCILSIMNGFSGLVENLFSAFDPELCIVSKEGASFYTDTPEFNQLRQLSAVDVYAETVVATALIKAGERQVPAIIKGCDDNFNSLTSIDSLLTEGEFLLRVIYEDSLLCTSNAFERCVPGIGLATQLNVGSATITGLQLYAPRRHGGINMLRLEESFSKQMVFTSGIFAVNQTKYDDNYLLVSLPMARALFQYDSNEATAIELKLKKDCNLRKTKRQIAALLGDDYLVQDRYEQQADFFKIMKIEKLLTTLLLVFILLIASFNIIGSLSMLMIDKQADCKVFRTMGADNTMLCRIFLYEGWFISLLGAGIGLFAGISLCLLQQHFGLLKLGSGDEYILSAYPVQVQLIDILITAIIVTIIGWFAAWIPTRKLNQQF